MSSLKQIYLRAALKLLIKFIYLSKFLESIEQCTLYVPSTLTVRVRQKMLGIREWDVVDDFNK